MAASGTFEPSLVRPGPSLVLPKASGRCLPLASTCHRCLPLARVGNHWQLPLATVGARWQPLAPVTTRWHMLAIVRNCWHPSAIAHDRCLLLALVKPGNTFRTHWHSLSIPTALATPQPLELFGNPYQAVVLRTDLHL